MTGCSTVRTYQQATARKQQGICFVESCTGYRVPCCTVDYCTGIAIAPLAVKGLDMIQYGTLELYRPKRPVRRTPNPS